MTGRGDEEGIPRRLIFVLALLSATAPIATDMYLASFPEIADGLSTDAHHVQLTLTAFVLGLGAGQVFWGPLSDRVGRLRPILVGTVVSVVASAVAVAAPTIEVLIAARFVQAAAAAASLVVGRAIISDLARGFTAAHAISLMMTINSVAPVAAPVIGGLLVGHVSWRGVLAIVLAMMVVQALSASLVIRETLPAERRAPRLTYRALVSVARRPAFLAYAGTTAFGFGTLMTYVSSSSFVYQSVLGLPGWAFGLGFAVNALAIMAGGRMSTILARGRVHPASTVRRALVVLVVASALVLAAALSPWHGLLLVPLVFVTGSFGLISGNASTLAMEQSRDHAGAGSAVLGGLQFLTAGVLTAFSGVAGEDTAVPMGAVMTCAALLCAGSFLLARRMVVPESERAFAS